MLLALLMLTAAVVVGFVRIERKIMGLKEDLQAQLDKQAADMDTMNATIAEVVHEIADLKLQVGQVVTQEQVDAATAITSKLEAANAALKAGE